MVTRPSRMTSTRQAAKEYALLLCAAPLYCLGWLAGVMVRWTLFVAAAIVAGYKAGRLTT